MRQQLKKPADAALDGSFHQAAPVQAKSQRPGSFRGQGYKPAMARHSLGGIAVDHEASDSESPEKRPNRTGLPDRIKHGVEALSGVSLDDVTVYYNSSKPERVHALAYAQGTEIHLGPGQERHLPEETWHVTQQKQGRVRSTMKLNGFGINNDRLLEAEAERMGNRAQSGGTNQSLVGKSTSKEPQENVLQRVFIFQNKPLDTYTDDIEYILEANETDPKILANFKKIAAEQKPTKFENWGQQNDIDWELVLENSVGVNPGWEKEIFGQRMTGTFQSGFVPRAGQTRMLEKVDRSDYYAKSEDSRILQVLRQMSSQLYLNLLVGGELAKDEQEIQTMWAYGNLLIGSNQPGTTMALYNKLNKASQAASSSSTTDELHSILTQKHQPKGKGFLEEISGRHAQKIENLYQDTRLTDKPKLQEILQTLVSGKLELIDDKNYQARSQDFAKTTGNIYVLSAKSPKGLVHAEQRLIEFRDLVHDDAQKITAIPGDSKTYVAGKKRPCFGCWIREHETSKAGNYELIYQDQPGKAFKGTYMAAPFAEQEAWNEKSKEQGLKVYESKRGGGEIGPESESEGEEEMEWKSEADLRKEVSSGTKNKRAAVKRHFDAADADFDDYENLVKKSTLDSDEEKRIQDNLGKVKSKFGSHKNPGLRKAYASLK